MIALAIAYGAPEFIISSVATLLCTDKHDNISINEAASVEIPENHQKLANLVRRILLRNTNEPGW